MDVESCRAYCLSFKGAEESMPFDSETVVFKVCGKMFALVSLETSPGRVTLKGEPEKILADREAYPDDVLPGYHMNKSYWNTVNFNKKVSDDEIREWIGDSYELIVKKLPKYKQEELTSC